MFKTDFLQKRFLALLWMVLLISLFPHPFAAGAEKAAAPEAPREYKSSDGRYRITIPKRWEKSDRAFGPADLLLFCDGSPGVNISVIWSAAGEGEELNESVAKEMKELCKQRYEGYEVTAEEWRKLGGVKAYCISARFKQHENEIRNKQVMLIKGGKTYILTYTAMAELFMKHLGEFEKAVDSFRTTGAGKPVLIKSPGG